MSNENLSTVSEKPPTIKVKIKSQETFSADDLPSVVNKTPKSAQPSPQVDSHVPYPMIADKVATPKINSPIHLNTENLAFQTEVSMRGSLDVTRAESMDGKTLLDESGIIIQDKSLDKKATPIAPIAPIVQQKTGETRLIMAILSEMWIFHIVFILGLTYVMTFVIPQGYITTEYWNTSCYWKIGWLLPLPYTLICFFSLSLPFRTPKFLEREPHLARRIDNLYILTVTKGDNKQAVMRAWNAHKHLEKIDPCIRVHVLTDEPHFFDEINCFTCPKSFTTAHSKYKARALEWYRLTMRYTEYDWILHLDEESVIDDESVKACLDFIRYEHEYAWGQGVIIYNQYRYWSNWFFTVADAIRVGDDLARFHLQYTYFHRPIFGAHGSFLLTNGVVENTITWDLGSLTEDYQFATHAWELGYKCGKVAGLVREQSPFDLIGFLKQRRRWFVGIRRLPNILPKIWWTFWTLGTFALYFTIISVALGFIMSELQTPLWLGLLKDFSFINFVYLYLLGIFIQDVDKGKNFFLVILHIPLTFLLQFFAVILEAMAVMYGLIFPPADFDVIKK